MAHLPEKKFTNIPGKRKAADRDSPAPPPEPNQHTHTGQSRVRPIPGQRTDIFGGLFGKHTQ